MIRADVAPGQAAQNQGTATTVEALAERPVTEIIRAFRSGGPVGPVALTKYLLARAREQSSPVFTLVTADRALAEAARAERRLKAGRPLSLLDGVPTVWKDSIDLAGTVTTAGSALLRDRPPAERDAAVVVALSGLGMISLGKVNMTELAFSGLGLNPHFGHPANACDAGRVPGGSSSGSGVAVAAGYSPCAIGTDTGGSVRIPAAFNGLIGFKGAEGRVSRTGVVPLSRTLDVVGPITRTVADCILLDAALRCAAPTWVAARPLSEVTLVVPETVVMEDAQPAVMRNFDDAVGRMEAVGAKIRRKSLKSLDRVIQLGAQYGTIAAAEAYADYGHLVEGPRAVELDPLVRDRILEGKRTSASELELLHRERRRLSAELSHDLDGGFIVMPTVAHTAPEIAQLMPDPYLTRRINTLTLRNTMLANFLNLPSVAIPTGKDNLSLPTSLQLSCREGDEARLLSAALSAEVACRPMG